MEYPRILDRVKAIMADSVVYIILMTLSAYLFDQFDHVPDYARILAFVIIFVIYDPLLTSLFGGTLGHFVIGLRVVRYRDRSKKVIFPIALIRSTIKLILGSISMLAMHSDEEHRAIHDYMSGSIVVFKDDMAK
ncbi:MAG: RDD family protein [Flavobacteriales bacterium]|nr:RDD family protein [Flavobacteriales bacterium]